MIFLLLWKWGRDCLPFLYLKGGKFIKFLTIFLRKKGKMVGLSFLLGKGEESPSDTGWKKRRKKHLAQAAGERKKGRPSTKKGGGYQPGATKTDMIGITESMGERSH